MATRNDHLVWYCPSTRKTNGLQICHAKSFTEEEITYIVKKAARKLLKNAVPRLEKVLNDDYVERDRSTYKGQLADIDKAIDADLEEIEHIKAACLNNKTMNASEIARQKQTILDLRKNSGKTNGNTSLFPPSWTTWKIIGRNWSRTLNLEQKPCNGSSLYHRGEPEQENFCLELQICILKHCSWILRSILSPNIRYTGLMMFIQKLF